MKDAAKMEEPASLDTQTKVIVVFALHNGRHMIVAKVPHNPLFFSKHHYFYSTVTATTMINHLLSVCNIHIFLKIYFNNLKISPRTLLQILTKELQSSVFTGAPKSSCNSFGVIGNW